MLHGYGSQPNVLSTPLGKTRLVTDMAQGLLPDWKLPQHLHTPLAAILPDPSWLQSEDKGLEVPLRLTEGRELSVVVADVITQVER